MSAADAFFPPMVTRLPGAEIPVAGLTSHLAQAGDQQFVFMSFEHDVDIAEHSHAAQWGVVLDGEMELHIAGQGLNLVRGDQYFIPDGAPHRASIRAGYKDLTLFDQGDRYAALG
jgi:quercetin dioxygenase-like cupin family protein